MSKTQRFSISTAFVVLLSLAPGKAYADLPLEPQRTLTVFDSVGRRVGNALGLNFSQGCNPTDPISGAIGPDVIVAFHVEGQPVVLEVGRNGFCPTFGSVSNIFGFEHPDCSGQRFWDPNAFGGPSFEGGVLPPVFMSDQSVYVSEGPVGVYVLKSGFDSFTRECFPFEAELLTVPVRFVVDLRTRFTPPFSVR